MKRFLLLLILISPLIGFSQITFTPAELLQLAEQNLQRKECLKLQELSEAEIDSLNSKITFQNQQLELNKLMISNLKDVVANDLKMEELATIQTNSLKQDLATQEKLIKKQNRKIIFWKILTPVGIIATSTVFLLVK
jgi:hypothetical protein